MLKLIFKVWKDITMFRGKGLPLDPPKLEPHLLNSSEFWLGWLVGTIDVVILSLVLFLIYYWAK